MARVLLATQREAQAASYRRLMESKQGRTEISRYVIASSNGGELEYSLYTGACHSALRRHKDIVAISTSPSVKVWRERGAIQGGSRGSEYEGRLEKFYDKAKVYWEYLVNESPLAPVFLTKCLEKAEEGGVFINIKTPANLAMLAIIGTREPHEFPNRVEIWYSLVQAGADPWVSLLLMENLAFTTEKDSIVMRGRRSGDIHDMFDRDEFDSVAMKNFINLKYPGARQPISTSGDFDGIHRLWRRLPLVGRSDVLKKYLDGMPKDIERVETVYQRGDYVSSSVPATSYDAGIRYMAEVSHELRGKYHEET